MRLAPDAARDPHGARLLSTTGASSTTSARCASSRPRAGCSRATASCSRRSATSSAAGAAGRSRWRGSCEALALRPALGHRATSTWATTTSRSSMYPEADHYLERAMTLSPDWANPYIYRAWLQVDLAGRPRRRARACMREGPRPDRARPLRPGAAHRRPDLGLAGHRRHRLLRPMLDGLSLCGLHRGHGRGITCSRRRPAMFRRDAAAERAQAIRRAALLEPRRRARPDDDEECSHRWRWPTPISAATTRRSAWPSGPRRAAAAGERRRLGALPADQPRQGVHGRGPARPRDRDPRAPARRAQLDHAGRAAQRPDLDAAPPASSLPSHLLRARPGHLARKSSPRDGQCCRLSDSLSPLRGPMTDTDVLIVGAGPTGLMLANQLGRARRSRDRSSTATPVRPCRLAPSACRRARSRSTRTSASLSGRSSSGSAPTGGRHVGRRAPDGTRARGRHRPRPQPVSRTS